MTDKLENRIAELESIVFFLQAELHSATTTLDHLYPERRFPWRQEWVDSDDGGYFRVQKQKVFPKKERDLLIREFHRQGMDTREIAVALFERNHRRSDGTLWSDGVIEKAIKKALSDGAEKS